jgi:hypothetical protein
MHRYTTWVNVLALTLARLFPQPDLALIRSTSPRKFLEQYGGRLAGIIDATECKMQTSFDKLAQRATFSEYKHNNTVKYLVCISPAGATVYVSPAFPGRISDPQICWACANYANLDFFSADLFCDSEMPKIILIEAYKLIIKKKN